jgi:hypothetical protein
MQPVLYVVLIRSALKTIVFFEADCQHEKICNSFMCILHVAKFKYLKLPKYM